VIILGGLAVSRGLTFRIGCLRRSVALSNREFPFALKASKTRSLEGENDGLACVEKSPIFRYVTHGNLRF